MRKILGGISVLAVVLATACSTQDGPTAPGARKNQGGHTTGGNRGDTTGVTVQSAPATSPADSTGDGGHTTGGN